MAGVPRGGHTSGYRYFSLVGNLEFYMNNLAVEEESVIAGRPMALVSFFNPPILNQQLTILVNGNPALYVVQSSDIAQQFPQQSVLLNMVNLINSMQSGPWAGTADSPNIGVSPLTAPEFGQISISWDRPFNVEVQQNTTVGVSLMVAQNGDHMPEPSMEVKRDGQIKRVHGYINVLLALRNDLLAARQNLSLLSAGAKGDQGGVTFRPTELKERAALFGYFLDLLGSALYSTATPMGQPAGRVTV